MFTTENISFAVLTVIIAAAVFAGPRLARWWGQWNKSYRKAMADAQRMEPKS